MRTPKLARARRAAAGLLAALACALAPRAHAEPRPPLDDEGAFAAGAVPTLGAAPALDAFAGLPIARVEVVVEGRRWSTPVVAPSFAAGAAFTPGTARALARRLLDSGRFARAELAAERSGGGVALRITVLPRRIVAHLRVEGSPLEADALLHAARLAVGGEITEPMLDAAIERARGWLEKSGYPHAEVTIDARDTDDPAATALVVHVAAGAAAVARTRRIEIVGLGVGAMPTLDAELVAIAEDYAVGRGERLDVAALASADHDLEERLRARGFHRAEVEARVVLAADGARELRVAVTPGPKIVTRYEGATSLDADQLDDELDLGRESDRSASHLVAKLRDAYVARGFHDVEIDAVERGGPADRVHVLAFRVREHARVRVVSRDLPCYSGGPLTSAELVRDLDAYLDEELPTEPFAAGDPRVVDATIGSPATAGARPAPLALDASRVYSADAYERALKREQDFLRSEGYLSATVGPATIVRRACDPRSPAGRCVAVPLPVTPTSACAYDAEGLPVDEPPPDRRLACVPDPARGVECESAVRVRIPVKLGPRTTLYDVAFEGNHDPALVENDLARVADLTLGEPVSQTKLEAARRRVHDAIKERGYAFADVRVVLDFSPDRTRARARFVIGEGERVVVDDVVVRGAKRTDEALVLRRVTLARCPPGKPPATCTPYRPSDVRTSEERIATLGTFSSVAISLEDPHVPARRKRVIVEVQERMAQYLDIKPGFSTGEGFRIAFEYGHRNIGGRAIQLTLRVQLGYLPDPFILDQGVRANYDKLALGERLERRNTVGIAFPEIGLGPLFRFGVDGVDVRDNARDFGLTKEAIVPTLTYRPVRGFSVQLGGSTELNDVGIFNGDTVSAYLTRPGVTTDVNRLLRVPDGETFAVAERLSTTWDRRDSTFAATRGTYLAVTAEHVHAFPAKDNPNTITSDFLRASATVSGYVRLSDRGLALAASVRGGRIYQLTADSKTYPDRLFFLGGVDSMRGFLQDSLVPQDLADQILSPGNVEKADGDPSKLRIDQIAIRGGDVYLNPRLELRVPLSQSFDGAVFADAGNVWVEPRAFDPLKLRYASGAGLRLATPIGPIAFDYGVNLSRRPWEDFGAFHFSIGLF